MGDITLSDCIAYEDKVYCVREDGKLAVIQIQDIQPHECPSCVIEALYKKLLEKNGAADD
jgi:hypothetical protein